MRVLQTMMGGSVEIFLIDTQGVGYFEVVAEAGSLKVHFSRTFCLPSRGQGYLNGNRKSLDTKRRFETLKEQHQEMERWSRNPQLFFDENPDIVLPPRLAPLS